MRQYLSILKNIINPRCMVLNEDLSALAVNVTQKKNNVLAVID
jgi:hypothetical protein